MERRPRVTLLNPTSPYKATWMSTLADLQQHLLSSPLFLASKKLQYAWKRKDNGHVVCVLDEGKRGKVAVLSAVGRVSDSQANVDGVGAWRPSFNDRVEKSKFSFLLEKPEGTIFAKEWDRQLDSVGRIQLGICDNSNSRHFLLEDPSGSLLRFTKPVFEKKREGDAVLVHPRDWTVPDVCEDAFEEACKRFHVRPLQVYNEKNVLVEGDDIREMMVGSLVEVNFVLKHYTLKVSQSSPTLTYDCFSATIVSVTILQSGMPEEMCDFISTRDIRQISKEDTAAADALLHLKSSPTGAALIQTTVDPRLVNQDNKSVTAQPGAPVSIPERLGEPPVKRVKLATNEEVVDQGTVGTTPGSNHPVDSVDAGEVVDHAEFEVIDPDEVTSD
ncbi:hypothetical protein MIND_01163300 [Mycena indigotica]|uniref:Uncharacterized protein n=1 Tax=Mycena indigotica TaxID=2126181 RepID=A0A8H6VSS2_9AGAR|nr:uncharacterized protein MIND_01163300 [Mycena indigotica]KAF7292652.1 hypothetical protein MIND_01163300 [Mycena indigotica]